MYTRAPDTPGFGVVGWSSGPLGRGAMRR